MIEEEVKEVVDTLAGECPPPRCPNCKEALDSLYSREPSLEWDHKSGKFVETSYFGESPELCCPWCHKPVDTKLIFEKYYYQPPASGSATPVARPWAKCIMNGGL